MLKVSLRVIVLVAVFAVWVYHMGTLTPPKNVALSNTGAASFIDKGDSGLNQVILDGGTDFERGLREGKLTKKLIFNEEVELRERLTEVLPNLGVAKLIAFVSMIWFQGLQHKLEPWMLDEMYGISRSADHRFDDFADPYTRQLGYHALHEVGQYFVDFGASVYGCIVFAVPVEKNWLIGRNFDFEGGRSFDDDKIVKWVFAPGRIPFVSVIWAGMVGAVTGVNANGLYISINASGSRDFRRLGLPTTLLVAKILQSAHSLDEAVAMLRETPTFITDIFMVSDRSTGRVLRVEKSPLQTDIIEVTKPTVVANHLISPLWANDPINIFRRDDLTSATRQSRGEALLVQHANDFKTARQTEKLLANFLRDHADIDGDPLPLGHRSSIDPLIAVHSIVYNSGEGVLFVNRGPGSRGAYIGYDLAASFKTKRPVVARTMPADDNVTPEIFAAVRQAERDVIKSMALSRKKKCDASADVLQSVPRLYRRHYSYLKARGDLYFCQGRLVDAKTYWQRALDGRPAYASERKELEKLVK